MITEYLGDKWEVVIPSMIRGIPVTSIGDAVWDNDKEKYEGSFSSKSLIKITIPNNVTWIGEGAFARNQLTSVTIPNSVEYIVGSAFIGNPLISITIGANVNKDLVIQGNVYSFDLEAFNNGFEDAYINGGKLAGTYTRPNTESTTWTRK